MLGKIDDISLNKAAIIKRCIARIQEEYKADPELKNFSHIDALTLNIERACQAAIDLAFHIVASEKLGMPQNSGESFLLLSNNDIITEKTAKALAAMTGFRNISIHEYQKMDRSILRAVAETHWTTFVTFCGELGISI